MKNLKDYGGYALITGASSGIGLAFAREIASQSVPCYLVARRAHRLRQAKNELMRSHGVDVQVIAQDLSADDAVEKVLENVRETHIGILINNAGFGDGGKFQNRDPNRMAEMIKLNCLTPTLLTRALLPQMLERGTGAIVVVSSALGLVPCSYEAVYGATKAFDLSLGGALWGELQGTGVDVTTICPSNTATEFLLAEGYSEEDAAAAYKGAATPESIVKLTLQHLGKKPIVIANEGRLLNFARRVTSHATAIKILKANLEKEAGRR